MADLTRITDQTTALLNAGTRSADGSAIYSSTVGDKARSPEEIEASCINAALMTAKAICESDSSPFRGAFLDDMALVHGEPLPFHYGDTSVPVITPFPDASFTLNGTRKAYDRIEAYRINKNGAYGPAHNASYGGAASPLAGFYDLVNGIFYFTGYSATMKLADFDRTDVISKLPDSSEATVIKLACGLSAKEGDVSDSLFQAWYQQGMSDLNEIRSGATAFQPIDEALAMRGDRVA